MDFYLFDKDKVLLLIVDINRMSVLFLYNDNPFFQSCGNKSCYFRQDKKAGGSLFWMLFIIYIQPATTSGFRRSHDTNRGNRRTQIQGLHLRLFFCSHENCDEEQRVELLKIKPKKSEPSASNTNSGPKKRKPRRSPNRKTTSTEKNKSSGSDSE